MHIGESQIRFGMVSSRIFIGEKRCGTVELYCLNVCSMNAKEEEDVTEYRLVLLLRGGWPMRAYTLEGTSSLSLAPSS